MLIFHDSGYRTNPVTAFTATIFFVKKLSAIENFKQLRKLENMTHFVL